MLFDVFKKKMIVWREKEGAKVLQRRIVRFLATSLEDVMVVDVVTLSPRAGIDDAMHIFTGKNIGCIIIAENNRPLGILTERDILRRMEKGAEKESKGRVRVEEIMSSSVKYVSPHTSLGEGLLYSLRNKVSKLPLVSGNALKGIVTQTDLQRLTNRFFTENEFDQEVVPTVGSIMSNEYVCVENEAMIAVALSRLISRDLNAIIAIKNGSVVGILTERDILSEYIVNPSFVATTPVGAVMKTKVVSVGEKTTIIEANRLMLNANVRRLPVLAGDELVGIVTQENILAATMHFFSRLCGDELVKMS
jgi:CBS domain-containing protein